MIPLSLSLLCDVYTHSPIPTLLFAFNMYDNQGNPFPERSSFLAVQVKWQFSHPRHMTKSKSL